MGKKSWKGVERNDKWYNELFDDKNKKLLDNIILNEINKHGNIEMDDNIKKHLYEEMRKDLFLKYIPLFSDYFVLTPYRKYGNYERPINLIKHENLCDQEIKFNKDSNNKIIRENKQDLNTIKANCKILGFNSPDITSGSKWINKGSLIKIMEIKNYNDDQEVSKDKKDKNYKDIWIKIEVEKTISYDDN